MGSSASKKNQADKPVTIQPGFQPVAINQSAQIHEAGVLNQPAPSNFNSQPLPIPSAPSYYPDIDAETHSPPKNVVKNKPHISPHAPVPNQKASRKEQAEPDILFDSEEPNEQVNQENDFSSIPDFNTHNCSLLGKWVYHLESTEIEFPDNVNQQIERDFVSGQIRCKFDYSGNSAEILFRECLITVTDSQGEKMVYPTTRTAAIKEKFWWIANDGIARPVIKEVEDLVSFTEGVFSYSLDGFGYQINLHKKFLAELHSGLKRNLIIA